MVDKHQSCLRVVQGLIDKLHGKRTKRCGESQAVSIGEEDALNVTMDLTVVTQQ